jgi:hypothetical protein
VVKGVEGAVMVDCDFEAAPRPRVLHGDSHCVIPWMPEELNVDTIALSRGELAAGARPAAVDFDAFMGSSSFLSSRLAERASHPARSSLQEAIER